MNNSRKREIVFIYFILFIIKFLLKNNKTWIQEIKKKKIEKEAVHLILMSTGVHFEDLKGKIKTIKERERETYINKTL